ncbi:MAG: T9SS C-terminal target domain-containing protein [Saprospirales bacterium]|nr:MAG: T9SS C-terminal target domain-containing protein [Saprospirales bacterium]
MVKFRQNKIKWTGIGLLTLTAPLFVFILCFTISIQAQSGFELTPLTYNEKLQEKASKKTQLPGQFGDHFRSGEEPEIIHINISSNGTTQFCPENPFLGELLDSIADLSCSSPQNTTIEIADNCLIFEAGPSGATVQSDTFCIMLTGSEGSEADLLLLVNVRPIRSLPFVDDFSYSGPFPHPDYWIDRFVFVNNTLVINPVSVGTATFDGIDDTGRPYGGDFGRADHLTSAFIDMTSAIPGQCFLTFYIQAGGYSYVPDNAELLILEFKTEDGDWEEITSYSSADHPDNERFYFKSIQLEERFFYEDFKFRFVNLADGTGMNSNWHLNYVKLANEFQADLIFENDIAFTRPPSSALERYTAMPFRQFVGHEREELATEIQIGLHNHFNGTRQADPSNLRIIEASTGQQLLSETLLEVPPVVDENQRDLDPGFHFFTNNIQNEEPYKNNVEAMTGSLMDKMIIRTEYSFQQNEEQIPELIRNNQVSGETVISDYYAYDDGSAERAFNVFFGTGSSAPALGVQYHSNTGDTLRGIAVNLPRISPGDRNKRFRLMVWGASLDDEPLFESENLGPRFVDVFHDSIQGFSTYALRSPVTGNDTAIYIPAGDFHVGWKQISRGASGVYVGFDSNNPDNADHVFFSDGAIWRRIGDINPGVRGAVMIRPIFSDEPVVQTNVFELDGAPKTIRLYPNPANDEIHFGDSDALGGIDKLVVYSMDGKMYPVSYHDNRVDITHLPPGSYILAIRYKNSNELRYGQFIKQDVR